MFHVDLVKIYINMSKDESYRHNFNNEYSTSITKIDFFVLYVMFECLNVLQYNFAMACTCNIIYGRTKYCIILYIIYC